MKNFELILHVQPAFYDTEMILDVYSITDFIQVITQLENLYDISVCQSHVPVTCSTLTVLIETCTLRNSVRY